MANKEIHEAIDAIGAGDEGSADFEANLRDVLHAIADALPSKTKAQAAKAEDGDEGGQEGGQAAAKAGATRSTRTKATKAGG